MEFNSGFKGLNSNLFYLPHYWIQNVWKESSIHHSSLIRFSFICY